MRPVKLIMMQRLLLVSFFAAALIATVTGLLGKPAAKPWRLNVKALRLLLATAVSVPVEASQTFKIMSPASIAPLLLMSVKTMYPSCHALALVVLHLSWSRDAHMLTEEPCLIASVRVNWSAVKKSLT